MKIIHIASGDLWAGGEAVVYELIKGFARYDECTITAIFLNHGKLAELARSLGIKVFVLDEKTKSFSSILRGVRKIIKTIQPDIIHSHRYKENALCYLASKGFRHIKLIATQHGMPEITQNKQPLKYRITNWCNFMLLSRCFHATVAVSHEMKRTLTNRYGFNNDKTIVIHNGISIPDDAGFSLRDRFYVGSAGRLFPVKNYPMMVDIAHLVAQKRDDIDFILAGDGPQKMLLTEKIKDYGLQDRFILAGHVDDMADFYRNLDLYINTSLHEGLPMSILEAMSLGKPVIAPNIGGMPEIITTGEEGYLLPGSDPNLFAEKCLEIFENNSKLEILSNNARKRIIDSFSIQAMGAGYLELYKKHKKALKIH